jgi:uncharacterized membrane protein HdeD (DUF308 family)
MEIRVTSPSPSNSVFTVRETPATGPDVSPYWWLWLVAGIAWIVASLIVLQFDHASITTVGVIVGIMFAVASAQQFVLMVVADSLRWLWGACGVLFGIAAILSFIHPESTFAAFADILGFLFLCVGVWWTVRAFLVKAVESTWWVDLVAGIMMLVLAFWTSGQFFIEKAYTLLVFAGIWALLHGITDIVGAFRVRSSGRLR